MPEPSKGIVYVATKEDRYVAEAFVSATSAKALMPQLSITLFTNLTDSVFAQPSCFDDVVHIDTVTGFDKAWSEGQLDRIHCLPRSPYDLTLHLDADTRVCSAEVESVFSLLQQRDIAMVECSADNSQSCRDYGRPMFNVGFILYRKSDKVMQLLREWARLTDEFFRLARGEQDPDIACLGHVADPARRRQLLLMDQLSFVQLFSPEVNEFGLEYEILDETWNYRGSLSGRPPPPALKVNHHPWLRRRLFARDLTDAALEFQKAGRSDVTLRMLRWINQEHPGEMHIMKLLVLFHMEREEHDEATGILEDMLRHFPGYAWAETAKDRIATLREQSPH